VGDLVLAKTAPRPNLLFDSAAATVIRQRAAARPGLLDRLRERCAKLLGTPAEKIRPPLATWPASEAFAMAQGFFLLENPEFAAWTLRRIHALFAEPTWKFNLHQNCICDHVMANVAALVACAHDLLGAACPADETDHLAEGLRRHLLLPFLEGTRERRDWWARAETESNWKIMTCGDAGLAICAFAEHWPEAPEALGLAARGVRETLERVPPEGDWPEGVVYWFCTLFYGLRFSLALKRLGGEAETILAHPALKTTGDYATLLTTPGGRLYNFNDNTDHTDSDEIGSGSPTAEGLLLLATLQGRRDWLATARRFPQESVLWLALDDPAIAGATPARTTGFFPRTGVAALRSGWGPRDTFVGFKCGPSDVGHSHLDANSFMVEAGGVPLLSDEGFWWYGHDFFGKDRFEYDNNASIGHNTLLVDGQGQHWGKDYAGRLLGIETGPGWQKITGDASRCYPGLLRKFIRTLVFLPPDTIVIRDVIACEGRRRVEWLAHYAGTIREDGLTNWIENQGVRMALALHLPDRALGWRTSDVKRATVYTSYDLDRVVAPAIRYRSFMPLFPAEQFEFVVYLGLGRAGAETARRFAGSTGAWTLALPDHNAVLQPESAGVAVHLSQNT
jgi:hypothetical protein